MNDDHQPSFVAFDATPEIFATDSQGNFHFPLQAGSQALLETADYDEVRLVVSVWHPSGKRSIDLDRAYVELLGCFQPGDDHWIKLAEIEPVVPPYGADSFDGWIVLPIFASAGSFAIAGAGFEPRARLQIRASAYFVS